MYKHLYDQFSHWFHDGKGQVWFYSDPHFGDEDVKYFRTNNVSDEEQVKRINSKIGKWDTIVFLGDIGDIRKGSPITKIRGYKVLIMGNHERGAKNYKLNNMQFVAKYKTVYEANEAEARGEIEYWGMDFKWNITGYRSNHLFDEVYEGPLMISDKILLSHEPIRGLDFIYNIHGHEHGNCSNDDHHLNLCAEHINYTPVCLKHIIESGALKNIKSIHRITIDNAVANSMRP